MSFAMTAEQMAEQNRLQKIAEWAQVDAQRLSFTMKERELRAEVIAENFKTDGAKTQHVQLDAANKLTVEFGIAYSFRHPSDTEDNKMAQADAADALEEAILKASPNEGSFIIDRLIKWKPELSVSEYNKLSPALKLVVDQYIKTSERAPSLKINPIKKK